MLRERVAELEVGEKKMMEDERQLESLQQELASVRERLNEEEVRECGEGEW